MTEKKKYYPELNAKINFPEMEKNILNFWEEDKTFEKSVHNRDGAGFPSECGKSVFLVSWQHMIGRYVFPGKYSIKNLKCGADRRSDY